MTDQHAILTLNAGSSSLKFALYDADVDPLQSPPRYHGQIRALDSTPRFLVFKRDAQPLLDIPLDIADHEQAIGTLLDWLEQETDSPQIAAAGHRVVHGSSRFEAPVQIDATVLEQLRALIPLAPLHMPHNLAAIEALQDRLPGLPQLACFDTAFHRSMALREQYYALPRTWFEQGVRRYGFHGLSYEYIAAVLPAHLGEQAGGRIIVAHLGHGASLCALHELRSVATTMGFTPLDGIPMATRPGSLDPGIVTWLQREAGLSVAQVDDMLNQQSGLRGLSGTSGDMRELLADGRPQAAEAVDYFVYHTQRAIASLAGALGGLDALIFTAGIGENSAAIRERICREARWLGIELDSLANAEQRTCISQADSPVSVWRIPTDEEAIIARHTLQPLRSHPS